MRVSFLVPGLHYGGVCRWALTLARHLENVEVASIITMGEGTSYEVASRAQRIAPVFSLPIVRKEDELVFGDIRRTVQKACRHSDALIVSAAGILPRMGDVLRRQARIVVCHVTPEWAGQAQRVTADVGHATHLVAVSKAAAECFPADREHIVIRNGVDLNRLVMIRGREAQREAWAIPQDAKVALWMGRFDQIKQPGKLLDALHHLPEEWYAVYAGCTGHPTETAAIIARAEEEHRGRVRFVPGQEHIGDFLAAADCLVVTSKAESGPLVMLEAMTAGVPVVSSDFPAVHELGPLAVQIVPQNTPAQQWAWTIEASQFDRRRNAIRPQDLVLRSNSAPLVAHQWEEFLLGTVLDWHRQQTRPQGIAYVERDEKPAIDWRPTRGDKPRVAFLSHSLQPSGGIEVWLQTLIDQTREQIDWRLLNISSKTCPDTNPEILSAFGVPWAVDDNQILADADMVLAWGVPSARRWLRGYKGPLCLVSHGTNEWTLRWIQALEPYATHFVGVSKQAAALFAGRAAVIHNGIDFERLDLDSQHRGLIRHAMGLTDVEFAVGFIGRLSDEKNPVAIAEACAKLGPRFRPVYFGRDSSGGAIPKQIDAANRQRIYASAANIAEAYLALDCVVVASPAEGFSLVTVEALYTGCPLVSTPVGILPEIEEWHGQVAVPIPIGATAAQLATAISVTSRSAGRIEVGKLAALDYSAQRMGAEWVRFIHEAVGCSPREAITDTALTCRS